MITSWLNYIKSYEHLFSIDNLQEQDEQMKKNNLWHGLKWSLLSFRLMALTSLVSPKFGHLFIYLVTFTHSKKCICLLSCLWDGMWLIEEVVGGEIWPSIYIQVLEFFWPSGQLMLIMFTERRQRSFLILFS